MNEVKGIAPSLLWGLALPVTLSAAKSLAPKFQCRILLPFLPQDDEEVLHQDSKYVKTKS